MSRPAANPIPEGFHSLTPMIVCKGALEAIDFYKRAFGAEELTAASWRRAAACCTPRSASAIPS